ncbi:MAG: hypothetical protein IIC83_11280, partial [Chloroflexi bacterium]|nr:hypothetical protein [Chloroflexota bacterium]
GWTSNVASLDVTAPPPPPATVMIHIGDLDGKARTGKRGWRTSVKIVVLDSDGNTVSKANVSGTWTLGTFSCTTNGKGKCTVRSGNIDLGMLEVMFRVDEVSHGTMVYDPVSNTDPDGDSDGTEIAVSQPPTVSKNSDNHGKGKKGD